VLRSTGAIDGGLLSVSTLATGTYHVAMRLADGELRYAPLVIVR